MLELNSDKHIRDIAGILELSSDDLNLDWLQEMIHSYGLAKEWEKANKILEQ